MSELKDRITAKIWRRGELILTITMPPEFTIEELQRHLEEWEARGCTCVYKRVPWGAEDEESMPRRKGVRR